MTRLYGRGKVGERVVTDTPRNQGKNTSVLGAFSLDGLIASMTVVGSTNKNVFETYIYIDFMTSMMALKQLYSWII